MIVQLRPSDPDGNDRPVSAFLCQCSKFSSKGVFLMHFMKRAFKARSCSANASGPLSVRMSSRKISSFSVPP